MKLTYPGPSEAVRIPSLGVTAQRGKPVDIDDDAVAASLIDQGWAASAAKPSTPARKAASTKEA